MSNENEVKINAALERAEVSAQVAQRAIDARDTKSAPALIEETLAHTLDALALCARDGRLNVLENLLPNAVYYVRVLGALNADPFDAVRKIGCGSSINAVPERSDTERVAEFFTKMVQGVDGLSSLASLLTRGDL